MIKYKKMTEELINWIKKTKKKQAPSPDLNVGR